MERREVKQRKLSDIETLSQFDQNSDFALFKTPTKVYLVLFGLAEEN